MYRHEAVEMARKMMELHGVTDELKPWVIDVVLKVANSAVWELPLAHETPPTRVQVGWKAVMSDGDVILVTELERSKLQRLADQMNRTVAWTAVYE